MKKNLCLFIALIVVCSGKLCVDAGTQLNITQHTTDVYSSAENDCGCDAPDVIPLIEGYYVMNEPLYGDVLRERSSSTELPPMPSYTVPDSFSWKEYEGLDWTTSAKHQGNCGSCWDFAACGAFESVIKIREDCAKLSPDLSEQYVLSCLPAAANNYALGCLGGDPFNAYRCMMATDVDGNYRNGALLETCFSYHALDSIPCSDKCPDWEDHLVPLSDCVNQWLGFDSPANREILKTYLMQHGPMAAGINVTQSFITWGNIHHDQNEYFPDPDAAWGNMLNHIIVMVGWHDDMTIDNGGYWICKNSWGTDWGYDGFFNIEYGALFLGTYIAWADYNPDSVDWPPMADAGMNVHGAVNQIVRFDGSGSVDADGPIVAYLWDFGDGTTGTGVAPEHIYTMEGFYTVSLTVTDSSNMSATDTVLVGIDEAILSITDISGGLRFSVTVHNNMGSDLNELVWSMTFTGAVFGEKERNGMVDVVSGNSDVLIIERLIGLGPGTATVNVADVMATTRVFLMGPFVIVRG